VGRLIIFVSVTRPAPASRQSTSATRATSKSLVIQRGLAVGKAGNPFEREADMVADKVTRADPSLVQRKEGCSCEGESSCSCDDSQTLHRKPLEIGEIAQHIVARAEDASIPHIPDSAYDPTPVEIGIGRARGGGSPLSEATRVDMEGRSGHDFRDVRVHAGTRDGALAQQVNARAFSVVRVAPARNRLQERKGK
jgi:hypothetical protein